MRDLATGAVRRRAPDRTRGGEATQDMPTSHESPERAIGSPAPTGRLDESYGREYAALYRAHWWWRARESHVARWVRSLASGRRLRALDIGCGDGLAWPALEGSCDLSGIEPDARLVPADSPHRSRIQVGPFPGVRPEGSFDLVLMLDVLEHIEDDIAAMAEVRRLLVPGGHVLLTVPALPALWSHHDVINGHYRRYVRTSLRAALAGGGLEVLRMRYCSVWTVGPLLIRRLAFRGGSDDGAFTAPPPPAVNAALSVASRWERRLTDLVTAPFGSSLIALARRTGS